MTRSDTLRSEIARLQDKKATHAKQIASQERAASTAREAARKKRDQAARSKSASTIRSLLSTAEREDKKVAAAEARLAKSRKDQGTADKSIASKSTAMTTAEASEKRTADAAQKTKDSQRRREELAHARQVVRASTPPAQVRYVHLRPPEPEKLRVLYLTANPEATESTITDPDGTGPPIRDLASRRPGGPPGPAEPAQLEIPRSRRG